MLRIFGGGRPDHPMADARSARRTLEQLPAQEDKALDELAHWLESVAAAEGFKPEQRFEVLALIDEAAQPRVKKLAREYLSAAAPSRVREAQMWNRIHEYYRQAGRAYAGCLDFSLGGAEPGKDALPLLLVRALRSLAQQIKWQHLRYGPIDPAAWGVLNSVYAFAELRGIAEAGALAYPGSAGESNAREEFLKAAMFSASSPDCLLPVEADIAERLIGGFARSFALANASSPELPYWTDLGQAMAPCRAIRPPATAAGLRCFGPGRAAATLHSLIQRTESSGQVPAELNLGTSHEAAGVLDVMRHLATYWAPEPPARKHPRHAVKSRLTIAHGFDGVLKALRGDAAPDPGESWVVENVSAGGFGALAEQGKSGWLRVGTLLAMQPDGGANWVVGIVRRVNRVSQQQARIGIQTLSKTPAVRSFELRGVGPQQAIVLDGGTEAAIALPAGVYTRGLSLEAEREGRRYVYMPQGIAERGEDYEVVRFREMVKES